MHSDVIAAIATGLIPGGIGIVRISGPGAVETAEKITEIKGLKLSEAVPRHLYYGFVRDGEKRLDEALIAVMPTITVEGLTGSMSWDASGAVTKTPMAAVIENGVYVIDQN